ncbi:MAG: anaerobic ribonucleoside-triphosphate reductase [Candidatus Desantisbacteria bacterium]
MFNLIQKRDGRVVPFDKLKIADAIFKAAQRVGGEDRKLADDLAAIVIVYLGEKFTYEHILHIEEIQDAVEKILVETSHAKTAKEYILYRDSRNRIRRATHLSPKETTDYALFVRSSQDDIVQWDRTKIIDALIREAEVEPEMAEKISREVEQQIKNWDVQTLTAPLIREMVDVKLIEHGLERARRVHTRLGLPLRDVGRVIIYKNKENANIPHNPEATNLTLAESIKKEYALLEVFSQDVADAHIRGDFHLHDLGMIDRPYCSGQSLEYVKKYGLDLTNALSIAKPAKHPETLLAHMVKYSAALQGHFAGAIGWDAINLFFAPFLVGMDDTQMHQLAQMLIFEYSQQSVARGGQAIFSDINLYWEVPKHFENVEAIGPGGQYTGKTYSEYSQEAQRFVWALFDVYKEGDGSGRPFFFPKPLVHITEKFFKTPGHEDFLLHVCSVASSMGNPYFVFDRGETAKISECCRLSFKLEASDIDDAKYPWKMRYTALQNITLNLPRVAYAANWDEGKLLKQLDDLLALSVKAHLQKRSFIESLLSLGSEGCLSLLTMKKEGEPYLRMHRATYLIGLLGLNEMVQFHTGFQLHESEEALKFGLKVIAHLHLLCKKFSTEYGMRFVLEQTPAESTAYRFAKLDKEHYQEQALGVVKGSIENDDIYYTNSTQLNLGHIINPIDRIKKEGIFHNLIEAGALTHVWLGESQPSAESVANLVKKVFRNTQNAQIAFSPEFTCCNTCGKVVRGLKDCCPFCGSTQIEGITRVTGYFSKISGWNKGKIAELKDRYRSGLEV